jgi:transcriptional regulator with XRE-family HTH domain
MASRASFREQLRRAIRRSGLSRYAIAKQTGIQQSQLSRFMSGERGLSIAAIEAICTLIGAGIVTTPKPKRKR